MNEIMNIQSYFHKCIYAYIIRISLIIIYFQTLGFPDTILPHSIDNNDDCDISSGSTATFEALTDINLTTQNHTEADYNDENIAINNEERNRDVDYDSMKTINENQADKYLKAETPATRVNVNRISSIDIQKMEMKNLMINEKKKQQFQKYVALDDYFGSNKHESMNKNEPDDHLKDCNKNDENLDDFDVSCSINSQKSSRNNEKSNLSDRLRDMKGGDEERSTSLREEISVDPKDNVPKTNDRDSKEFDTQKKEKPFILDSSWLKKLSMASPLSLQK
jgi:hypothetical protein